MTDSKLEQPEVKGQVWAVEAWSEHGPIHFTYRIFWQKEDADSYKLQLKAERAGSNGFVVAWPQPVY